MFSCNRLQCASGVESEYWSNNRYLIKTIKWCGCHGMFTLTTTRFVPRGYLVERWVRGCAAQIGCFFGLSDLQINGLFFFIWKLVQIWSRFAKCLIFDIFFLCQKVLMHPNLHGKMYWLFFFFLKAQKRPLQEKKNGLDIGCKFASPRGGYSSMIRVGTCRWDLKSRPIFIPNFAEKWDPL